MLYIGMSDAFRTYEEAKKFAEQQAELFRADMGLEKNSLTKEFVVFVLPMAQHRCGHELRCEVVSPMNLDTTRPGHGPIESSKAPCGWHGG